MPRITNFAEAQAALRPLYQNARTLYNLDTMRSLMAHLGNPQNKLRVIHVAGTSGKTSTTYYTAALLRAQGFTVGHTVSPHVDSVNERLQINLSPLPEAVFCALLEEFFGLVEASGVQPSYFEILAAMAYWEFARRGVDYAVIEVGMGGQMDATNIIDSANKIAVITDIGLDHTEILGETYGEIASYKAGIIMEQNDIFMYEQSTEVMNVVRATANKQQARMHELPSSAAIVRAGLPLFQQRNLGLACAVVSFIGMRDKHELLSQEHITKAANIVVPARLELTKVGDKTIITDGSHNKQKTQALLESLTELYPSQPIAILCGFVAGNETRWQETLDLLHERAEILVFTTFKGEQDLPKKSVSVEAFENYCTGKGYTYIVKAEPVEALHYLLDQPQSLLLATGSFYLLNHIRPLVMALS